MRFRIVIGAIVVVVAIAAAVLIDRRFRETAGTPAGPALQATTGTPPPVSGQAAPRTPSGEAPSFDIVRIEQGHAVIAGRAPPGARVSVLDGSTPLGEATADARGEWVVTPDALLAPGDHELGLSAATGDGRTLGSDRVVVVVVPEPRKDAAGRPAGGSNALAIAVPRAGNEPTKVLQVSSAQSPPGGAAGKGPLKLAVVDYDEQGRLVLSGEAAPRSAVEVYLDNRHVGRAQVDEAGHWKLVPDGGIEPGIYTLRLDEVDAAGRVSARIALPFARGKAGEMGPAGPRVVVQPGNSLWRIARRVSGEGTRYTVIYQANKEQIRDPNMIYPGQIFSVPPKAP